MSIIALLLTANILPTIAVERQHDSVVPRQAKRFYSDNRVMSGESKIAPDPGVVLIPKIASIMREFGKKSGNMEWEKAAKLQDLWINYPKRSAMPVPPDAFDFSVVALPTQTGITFDWLLKTDVDSDGRARAAYDTLIDNLTKDPDGKMKTVIQNQVNRMFASTSANMVHLGGLKWASGIDFKAFHAQQVQRVAIDESVGDPLDPLLGAIGAFNFYAIPVGRAKKLADGTVRVDIDTFTAYVIDSFDFEGFQTLGHWKIPDGISKGIFEGSVPILNSTYREYRDDATANPAGKGGDFLVMTDPRFLKLPNTFIFTPDMTINGTWTSSDPKKRFRLAINGTSVEWTETGTETGIVYKKTLNITKQGDMWRIDRPNTELEVLKMLGFQDSSLQQAILSNNPHPSFLLFKFQGAQLVAKWSGIRVKKTPQGAFKSLVQPEDPSNIPGDYSLGRTD